MSENTKIEWAHHSFNTHWGCAKVSPACDNCYAERDAARYYPHATLWGPNADRRAFGDKHWATPIAWNRRAEKAGERYRVFCNSMADTFDNNAPPGVRDRLWDLIKATPNLDWLLLTKRIGNAKVMLPQDWSIEAYPNVWLGISVCNQEEADRDIPKLLATTARVRWISAEPLLGPIVLRQEYIDFLQGWYAEQVHVCRGDPYVCGHKCPEMEQAQMPKIDWVVAGGESGPNARPSHPEWFRSLREQCASAGTQFFFKQFGEWMPISQQGNGDGPGCSDFPEYDGARRCVLQLSGEVRDDYPPGAMLMRKIGKKESGRSLDGREHDEFPS